MADDASDSNKTEEPSDRKLAKAREEGQVAYTKEIGSNLALMGIVVAFYAWGLAFFQDIINSFKFSFSHLNRWELSGMPYEAILPAILPLFQFIAVLLFISFLLPILGHVLQKGMDPKWESAGIKWDKLDPISSTKQLFSVEPIIQFVKNFFKTLGLALIFYLTIRPYIDRIIFMAGFPVESSLELVGLIFVKFFLYSLLFLTVISALDYLVNYRRIRKKLMMSRQEIKDEFRETEGSPEIRNKVKQVQRERAKRQIQKEVPKATVVVTNPTHYAVALKYERGKVPVPKLVAKGVDLLAKRIREVAKENKVPVVESPALARALYREVKVGKDIPYKFYKAVAKIVGAILRLEEEKKQQQLRRIYGATSRG